MSKFADLVQWIQKNPPPSTSASRQKTEQELAIALCGDLDAIEYGDLEDPDQFVNDLLFAIYDLIEVFVDNVTKEDEE